MPLSGYITDKKGSEWVAAAFLFLAIPWAVVLIIERKLALFVVAFGFMSKYYSRVFRAGSMLIHVQTSLHQGLWPR